jgi:O-antigen/teichoic acid export membrane protein
LGIIAAQIDRYLVAAYAGAIYLGYYSIASAVAMQLHAFFSAGAHWLFPYVSRKVEHNIDVTHIYYKAQTAVVFAGVAAITLIFCLRDPLFGLWLGNITYPNSKRLIEMFLYFNILMVPTIVPYYFFLGSGYIRLSTILILISTVMTILFMAAGFSAIGNLGLIAGKITAVIIVSPLLLRFLHNRVLGETGVFAGIKLFLPSMLAVLALSLRTPLYSGVLFVLALAAFRLFCPDRRSSAMPRMA